MKQTLAQQLVQDWGLLDLKPMHRALLRRSAEQLVGADKNWMESKGEIAWHIESWRDSSDQALLEMMCRPGVLMVDSDALMKRVREDRHLDAVVEAIHQRSNNQIRLLWHWSLRGKQDLLWCTEMSFVGVVFDSQSLQQWLRACVRHGKANASQNNTLLSGIQLPNLATPKLTSNENARQN